MKKNDPNCDILIGKQFNGTSDKSIKEMALKAYDYLKLNSNDMTAADIGCGAGEFTRIIHKNFNKVISVDYLLQDFSLNNVVNLEADLNFKWPIQSETIDFVFALEVIEHVENPRHFFREAYRVLKPGGYFYFSTPNNHSIFSKAIFFIKGEHRYFQDESYPGHITPLLQKDVLRMSSEVGFSLVRWFFNNEDKLPFFNKIVWMPGKLFSKNMGVILLKSPQ